MAYAPGTLVRVKDVTALSSSEFVANHGYLWIVERHDPRNEWYTCRSVATGFSTVSWRPDEIEGADDGI